MVLLRDAGDRVAAPDRVVQAAGQLERDLDRHPAEEGRQLVLVGPGPGGRRAGAELQDDRPALAVGGADLREGVVGAGAARQLDGEWQVAGEVVVPPGVPPQLRPSHVDAGVGHEPVEGAAQDPDVDAGAGDDRHGQCLVARPAPLVQDAEQVVRGRGGDEQGADRTGVGGGPMAGVGRDSAGERAVAGREHGGVVDQRAEERRRRRHGANVARRRPGVDRPVPRRVLGALSPGGAASVGA